MVGLAELEVFGRESLLGDVVTGQRIEGVSIDIGLFYKFYTIFSLVNWFLGLLIVDLAFVDRNSRTTPSPRPPTPPQK